VKLELGDDGFFGGRKTGKCGEKPSEQGENRQQTQPTCGTGPESNLEHIAGRRALSPVCEPCRRPAFMYVVVVTRASNLPKLDGLRTGSPLGDYVWVYGRKGSLRKLQNGSLLFLSPK